MVRLPHFPFVWAMKDSSEVLSILHDVIEAYYRDANQTTAGVVVVAESYECCWRYDDAYAERRDVVDRHLYRGDAFWDRVEEVDRIHHLHVYASAKAVKLDRLTVSMMICASLG